jgi:hypothetical protein
MNMARHQILPNSDNSKKEGAIDMENNRQNVNKKLGNKTLVRKTDGHAARTEDRYIH